MIDSMFYDSDCLSAFLWVGRERLVTQLYSERIVIPKPVYAELSNPRTPHLKRRLDRLLHNQQAQLEPIMTDTEEYKLYLKLTMMPDAGYSVIGKGEAAAIALAKMSNGIVASNNLRDVSAYVQFFGLRHITTADILVEAMERELIDELQGNQIWADMLKKRRKLGAATFTDYLKLK